MNDIPIIARLVLAILAVAATAVSVIVIPFGLLVV
jgi:hypothetical protein